MDTMTYLVHKNKLIYLRAGLWNGWCFRIALGLKYRLAEALEKLLFPMWMNGNWRFIVIQDGASYGPCHRIVLKVFEIFARKERLAQVSEDNKSGGVPLPNCWVTSGLVRTWCCSLFPWLQAIACDQKKIVSMFCLFGRMSTI